MDCEIVTLARCRYVLAILSSRPRSMERINKKSIAKK